MKYALRGITAEELSYNMNRIQITPNSKFELKPQFGRQIRKVKENDKLYFLVLEVKIESTEAEPKPFNLKCRLVGAFEAEDVVTEEDKQILTISMTEIVYPYLRAAVSSLTATAFVNPIMLPVIPAGTMFPEDNATSFNTPDVLN
ncbi:MAG: protein-export chaperone SecB [Clostridia bacterium]|nr:protein-export chaperone SecB [Clostridia bacterium]